MSSQANNGFSTLKRNSKDARWLGVCAGVADWLEIPAALVRVIFVICVIAWPTLAIGYFILYFCLCDNQNSEPLTSHFKFGRAGDHFRDLNYRKSIHKNERNKRVAGVCSGIADYLEVSPFVVRLVTLGSLFIFGPFTFWGYIICAFVFDPDPNTTDKDRYARKMAKRQKRQERRTQRYARRADKASKKNGVNRSYVNVEANFEPTQAQDTSEFAQSTEQEYESQYSFDECKNVYQSMETRLRDIEAYMTSTKFRLHCEINRI